MKFKEIEISTGDILNNLQSATKDFSRLFFHNQTTCQKLAKASLFLL